MRTWSVGDVMTKEVVSVDAATPYRDMVDVLVHHRFSAVPVMDASRRVIGVVSEADLLRKIEYSTDQAPRLFEGRRRRAERSKAHGRTAADLMSAPAVVAMPSTSVAAAARLMDAESVKRLPVIDDLGRLVGIVSRADLLKVHLRPDDAIRSDIEAAVLTPFLADDACGVAVDVAGGVVTLNGQVDRWSSVDIAVRLASQVAGVVEVRSALTYLLDDRDLRAPRQPFGATMPGARPPYGLP